MNKLRQLRRKELATYCNAGRFASLQTAANDLEYTSKTAVRNDSATRGECRSQRK